MPICITRSFGREATMKRLPEWLSALSQGFSKAPRCLAPTAHGRPCQRLKMKGGSACARHLHGEERTAVDLERSKRAWRLLNSSNARHRAAAEATLRAIERRRLHLHWRHQNPDVPGSTLILPDSDERRLAKHLQRTHNLDLASYRHDALEPRRGLSARAIDRIRWAGVLELSQRISPLSAGNRVRAAIRDDVRWFLKHGW